MCLNMRMCGIYIYSLYHLLEKKNSSSFIQYFLKAKAVLDARELEISDMTPGLIGLIA